MKELRSYTINGHVVTLSMDNMCGVPFFVVRLAGRETFAGKRRDLAIDALDRACAGASSAEGSDNE